MEVKDSFRSYLEEAIGQENACVAFSAFSQAASVSIRINPHKPLPAENEMAAAQKVLWSEHGRILQERPVFTLDPLFHAGAYYVQDSSSMFVGEIFRYILAQQAEGRDLRTSPLRVLDLCAAPGGKTTDLAASLRTVCGDNFILVANEVMKQRVQVLADNVAIWGDPNVAVANSDPADFTPMSSWFDVILADVPCSGEGMFRKDVEAQQQWSEDNVKLCQLRQRRIVADVWPSLREGGVFIYSTCTFNRLENDENVEWMADELGGELLFADEASRKCFMHEGVIATRTGFSLVPGFVPGEGQFCSALKKTSGILGEFRVSKSFKPAKPSKDQTVPAVKFTQDMKFKTKGELIIAIPAVIKEDIDFLEGFIHLTQSGCAVGTVKGKDLVPSADLALCRLLAEDAFVRTEVSREEALKFLHKDAIVLKDAPRGLVLVTYMGLPLGFVKNLGNRTNNLHPQSRRIRMDIK